MTDRPLVEVRDISVRFRVDRRRDLTAVDTVSMEILRGQTVGLVGESGSGKSTLARTIMRAVQPSSGSIIFDGHDITEASERELRSIRPRLQMVFQDPFASLDPRMRIQSIVAEPLQVHRRGSRNEIGTRVADLLNRVGLPTDAGQRFPGQFSGGQRQRISIARALALEPELLVADEPVSALDVSVQAQIIRLLAEIRREFGLTILIIAHDLALVHQISDIVAVMHLGEIVEIGGADELIFSPLHPYTASLISAHPVADPRIERSRRRIVLAGEPPSPIDLPPGCRFASRCPIARDHCHSDRPALREVRGRRVACHHPGEFVSPIESS